MLRSRHSGLVLFLAGAVLLAAAGFAYGDRSSASEGGVGPILLAILGFGCIFASPFGARRDRG